MAYGVDYLFLIPIFFLVTAALFSLTSVGPVALAALANVPGYTSVNPALASIAGVVSPYQATNSILSIYPRFDNLLLFVFFTIMIAIVAAAALTPTNPIVIPLTFFTMLVVLLITFMTSNMAHAFLNATVFAPIVGLFPNLEGLWANLGATEFVFFLLLIIVEAIRSRSSGGAGGGAGLALSGTAAISKASIL